MSKQSHCSGCLYAKIPCKNCKGGSGFAPANTTRLIEESMHYEETAWKCEQCGDTRCYEEGTPQEHDVKYCCACGRKVTEYKELEDQE